MKIAILHTRLSGYMVASWRALKRRTGAEFLIYAWPNQPDAPFDVSQFSDLGTIHNRNDFSTSEIEVSVRDFRPNAILTSGWADRGYMKVCRKMRKTGVPVIAGSDNQWIASPRQIAAILTSRFHIRRWIDALWVAGERQATFARALGYSGVRLWDGVYACDWASFASADIEQAVAAARGSAHSFLFVGRYVDVKGIDTLAEAYRRYRATVPDPWPLVCAGAGPLGQVLRDAGADDRGFVQPQGLPALMQGASALVLPSRFEPWGVVVQEAAAGGVPLILSERVGAGVHLLRPGFNGYTFPAGSVEHLLQRLLDMHALSDEARAEMMRNSYMLSRQYSPERWADVFCSGLRALETTRN
ncbi:MAG: glycosyl transferase group 1 [Pseudooceanicola sp.]|nr:glycosyl transferase group 1 [Pseudooceanicola sp.]